MITHSYAHIQGVKIFAETDLLMGPMSEEKRAVLLNRCASALNTAQMEVIMMSEEQIKRRAAELSKLGIKATDETLQKP